jgi:hypothetical protein
MHTNGDDNATLAKKLRKACPKPNLIKLPGSIKFTIDGSTVRMHLAPSCVEANMQDNSSSFEGWALALTRWLPEVSQIELSWTFNGNDHAPHYQRFLFRAQQFRSVFSLSFSIASPQDELIKRTLRTEAVGPYFVTAPKKERITGPNEKCANIADAWNDEKKLECYIKDNPTHLPNVFGIIKLDRQYPVGLFDGDVKKGREIFPRGHSAIDLWGVNKAEELFLFELKANGNTRIGILSELFFYSYVMERIQQKKYNLQEADGRITSSKTVRAYILAPQWHPLIDKELLRMINDAFRRSARHIRFGIVRIVREESPACKLELQACD